MSQDRQRRSVSYSDNAVASFLFQVAEYRLTVAHVSRCPRVHKTLVGELVRVFHYTSDEVEEGIFAKVGLISFVFASFVVLVLPAHRTLVVVDFDVVLLSTEVALSVFVGPIDLERLFCFHNGSLFRNASVSFLNHKQPDGLL